MTCELQPSQLADLLNYVLGRPFWAAGRKDAILFQRIDVCVVENWNTRYQRPEVTVWCERQLVLAGVLPKMLGSRKAKGQTVPHVVANFVMQQEGYRRNVS